MSKWMRPELITAIPRAGFQVAVVGIEAKQCKGRRHIRPLTDGIRFLIIILKLARLYAPLKLFVPASFLFFALGLGSYGYTFTTQ